MTPIRPTGIESRVTTSAGHLGEWELGPVGAVPAVSHLPPTSRSTAIPAAPIQASSPAAAVFPTNVPATIQTIPASGRTSQTNPATASTTAATTI